MFSLQVKGKEELNKVLNILAHPIVHSMTYPSQGAEMPLSEMPSLYSLALQLPILLPCLPLFSS